MFIKKLSPLALGLTVAFSLSACNQQEQTGSTNTERNNANSGGQTQPGSGSGGGSEPFNWEESEARFKVLLTKLVEDCKTSTTIEAAPFNFYSGFSNDGVNRKFSNFTGIAVDCDYGSTTEIDQLSDSMIAEDAQRFDKIYEEAEKTSGFEAYFKQIVADTQVVGSTGITVSEVFPWILDGNILLLSTFETSADVPATGTGTITFTYNGEDAVSDVVLTEYTEAQLAAGETKYGATCAGCHQSENGADHSPFALGTCSDVEIVGAVTAGVYAQDPANPKPSVCGFEPTLSNSATHQFTFTDDAERDAVVAYLRSLPLTAFDMPVQQ